MVICDPLGCPTQIRGVETDGFCGYQGGVLSMVNNHVAFVTVQAVTSRLKPEWLLRLVVSGVGKAVCQRK